MNLKNSLRIYTCELPFGKYTAETDAVLCLGISDYYMFTIYKERKTLKLGSFKFTSLSTCAAHMVHHSA